MPHPAIAYLDHHATTPVDPRTFAAMTPFFAERFGNAASVQHAIGRGAAEAVAAARAEVATLVGADPREVVFVSGATEANNLALKGTLRALGAAGRLVTTAAEHRATLDPARRLQREGHDVEILPVDRFGTVDVARLVAALERPTTLVSVMAANNEVGTLSPIAEIGRLCRERGALFHCDAAQAVGRVPLDVRESTIDLLSVSAHKLYGPQGIGALVVRRGPPRIRIEPLIDGGGHEQRLRSGTLPVALIVGFGEACRLAGLEMIEEAARLAALRDRLERGLRANVPGLTVNGHPSSRLAGNLNVSVADVDGDALLASLTEIAVSSGSACTSADPEPSHVLRAMGVPDALCRASLRFGLGRFTTEAEIDRAIAHVTERVSRLRSQRP